MLNAKSQPNFEYSTVPSARELRSKLLKSLNNQIAELERLEKEQSFCLMEARRAISELIALVESGEFQMDLPFDDQR